MSKYTSRAVKKVPPKPTGPHPIWSALGCLMLIVIPAMSIAGAVATVQYGLEAKWPIPPQLLRPVFLPGWLIQYLPGLANLLGRAVSTDYILAYAAISILYMILLGGVVSLFYAFLYRYTGPPRYGPLDSPPGPHRRPAKKSR